MFSCDGFFFENYCHKMIIAHTCVTMFSRNKRTITQLAAEFFSGKLIGIPSPVEF